MVIMATKVLDSKQHKKVRKPLWERI